MKISQKLTIIGMLSLLLLSMSCKDDFSGVNDTKVEDGMEYRKHIIDSVLRSSNGEAFYWYQDTKIPLILEPSLNFVLFSSDQSDKVKDAYQKAEATSDAFGQIADYADRGSQPISGGKVLKYELVKSSLNAGRIAPPILFKGDAFRTTEGDTLYTTEVVYVRLRSSEDYKELEGYARQLHFTIIGEIELLDDWYEVSCIGSPYNPLQIADILYNDIRFPSAFPCFIDKVKQTSVPNDPLFTSQ